MAATAGFEVTKDYYAALDVSQDVCITDLKGAFFRPAKELHPDKTGSDAQKGERFKRVREAYEVITDPKLRERYDRACVSAGYSTRANSFKSARGPSDHKPEPQPNSFFVRHPIPADPPATKCVFSDYYFDDYREKPLLQTFREAAKAAHDAWKLADNQMREAENTGMAASWGPDYSYYRQERKRKRDQVEDLRWKMDSAESSFEAAQVSSSSSAKTSQKG